MARRATRRGSSRTTARKATRTTRKPARKTTRATSARTRKKTGTTRKRTTARRATTSRRTVKSGSGQRIQDVMTSDPVTLLESETLTTAAQLMRMRDIGDVIVLDDTSGRVKGIVTDRDIVIRAIAEGRDPNESTVASVVSDGIVCLEPNDSAAKAVKVMRDRAIRRIPVVEGEGRPVGIVSLGDLAERLDRDSALADISAAPPQE